MLVLQLVAGENHKPEIFTEYHIWDDTFHFAIIQKKIMKKIPAVDAAFDAIEKKLTRQPGTRVE